MEFIHYADGEALSCTSIEPAALTDPAASGTDRARVVIMHGAGIGSQQRSLPLARDFAAAGHASLAFDFSGHGRSSGTLEELSLERRLRQALAVIEAFTGRAVLVVPERDEVIPPEVTAGIEQALRAKSRFSKMVLDGADHQLGRWLTEHPEHRARLVALMTDPALSTSGDLAGPGTSPG
ncbi:alpha/beta hydrolase [Streptomyces cuspidosporus]|uniref:Serine aminopeptidase S33 domain-containing protein n=1 Tax=Streptomyces cuspidosporus TaxID=66882 RepID=A0ABN3H6Q9_9ACTN